MKFIIGGLVLFALSILCLLISLNKIDTAKEEKKKAEKLLQKAYEIKAEKDLENETYLYNLLNQISQAKSSLSTLKKQIQEEETRYLNEREEIDRTLKFYENRFSYVSNQYVNTLEKRYEQIEKDFDQKVSKFQKQEEDLNNEIKILENQISNMRESLAANTKAALREQEKKNKLDFYKLTLTPFELEDIIKLNTIKTVLHQPVVLSKLIWSTYFQKQATEMCNRILGTSKICGIYKITYIETEQSYIGQSVDVAQRWKDHIKCGLGIDASATNKLYNAMQSKGVWNFTFELLEICPREQLNEKEKFWIESYQSHLYGFNTTKGNN